MDTSASNIGRVLEGKGSVTVQSMTLAALIGVGVMGGRYAERAETMLGGIKASITQLEATTRKNAEGVTATDTAVRLLDEKAEAGRALLETRIEILETCLAKGKKKCP